MYRMLASLLLAGCMVLATAQDTHYCPDGWEVHEHNGHVECILLGGLNEKVTKRDAEIICGGHEGWLVCLSEHHGGGHKNDYVKRLIQDKNGQNNIGTPGYNFQDQWWIGATVHGPHGDHNQGNWLWDHGNKTVTWFDWYDGEPNDWHSQDCLTYLKDQDIFGYGVYHWNDWGCNYVARYICERGPLSFNATLY